MFALEGLSCRSLIDTTLGGLVLQAHARDQRQTCPSNDRPSTVACGVYMAIPSCSVPSR